MTTKCDTADVCAARYRAVADGRFRPDFASRGWLWREALDPEKPWAKCPWCDRPLPDVAEVQARLIFDIRQADGWDGEEGG